MTQATVSPAAGTLSPPTSGSPSPEEQSLEQVYLRLRQEVAQYSEALAAKRHLVLLTKRDLLPPGDPRPLLEERHQALHLPIPEWSGLITTIALPYNALDRGAVYRFNVNHVVLPDDPCEMFPLELIDVGSVAARTRASEQVA